MTHEGCYYLALSTGQVFEVPEVFGAVSEDIHAELVFQTGMTGYCETLTDPSYAGQILVNTYPLQANYPLGDLESGRVWPRAVVVVEYLPGLSAWLLKHRVMGLAGLDTRWLTQIIRDAGSTVYARISKGSGEGYSPLPNSVLKAHYGVVDFMDLSLIHI